MEDGGPNKNDTVQYLSASNLASISMKKSNSDSTKSDLYCFAVSTKTQLV